MPDAACRWSFLLAWCALVSLSSVPSVRACCHHADPVFDRVIAAMGNRDEAFEASAAEVQVRFLLAVASPLAFPVWS